MQKSETSGRGRRSQRVDHFHLLRNSSRWTGVAIDDIYVGPMSLVELNDRQIADKRIKRFLQNGQLELLAEHDCSMQADKGRLLFRYYEEAGLKGDIVTSRSYAHGDIFLTAAFLESLHAAYPAKRLVFHTSAQMEPLVRYYANLDIITEMADLKDKLRYAGLYMDLTDVPERYEDEHAPEISRNRIEILCDYADIDPVTLVPSYYMPDEDVRISDVFTQNMPRPFIGLSPSTIRKEKSWRPERWRELALSLSQRIDGTVFIFDARDVLQLSASDGIVPMIGRTLRLCGAIASRMDLFVAHDSLWTHWAAALGVPQVLLASCTDGNLLSKGYPSVRVIQRSEWSCCPCWYLFHIGGCQHGQYPQCLDDVRVDEVFESIKEAL